jgi:hypothetical protein
MFRTLSSIGPALLLVACTTGLSPQNDSYFAFFRQQTTAGEQRQAECAKILGLPRGASIEADRALVKEIQVDGLVDRVRLAEVGPQRARELLDLDMLLIDYADCYLGPETANAVMRANRLEQGLERFKKTYAGDAAASNTIDSARQEIAFVRSLIPQAIRADLENEAKDRRAVLDKHSIPTF